jgi:predicted phage-related endonuclease
MEDPIARMYADEQGVEVRDLGATHICVHPKHDWLGATLDRVIVRPNKPNANLEIKNIGSPFRDGSYYSKARYIEQPYEEHQVQVQIQSDCIDSDVGHIAALFPGYDLVAVEIERDTDFLREAIMVLEEFWFKCVVEKRPPEPTNASELAVTKRLWQVANGKTVDWGHDELGIVRKLERVKSIIKDAKTERDQVEAYLRTQMGDNEAASLPDGRFLTLATIHRKAYTREIAAGSFRTLRIKKKIS